MLSALRINKGTISSNTIRLDSISGRARSANGKPPGALYIKGPGGFFIPVRAPKKPLDFSQKQLICWKNCWKDCRDSVAPIDLCRRALLHNGFLQSVCFRLPPEPRFRLGAQTIEDIGEIRVPMSSIVFFHAMTVLTRLGSAIGFHTTDEEIEKHS